MKDPVKLLLSELITKNNTDMATASRAIGRDPSYLFQFLNKGSPKKLPEDVREGLGNLFGINPDSFKQGGKSTPAASNQHFVPKSAVSIFEINVRAGAGGGQLIDTDGNEVTGTWVMPARIFNRQGLNTSSLRMIQAVGDSQVPDIHSGDHLLVDTSDVTPSPPGFFALWDGMGVVVKRLEYIPNSEPPRVRLLSANPAYKTYEMNLEECHISGRVVGMWKWT